MGDSFTGHQRGHTVLDYAGERREDQNGAHVGIGDQERASSVVSAAKVAIPEPASTQPKAPGAVIGGFAARISRHARV
jgi:hypothetical protein